MTFIIIFVSTLLILPLLIDYNKHGRDNIINRSSVEIIEALQVKYIKNTADNLIKQGNKWLVGIASLVVLIMVVYILISAIGFFISLFF